MKLLLKKIKKPADIKKFSVKKLKLLCKEIRTFLIDSVSKTGGHIGTNLGVIELTVALHYVFNSPRDKIIFDTGHQGYTHKLLTGRVKMFKTLNTFRGMSRFLTRKESKHDIIDASHGGTAISIATGIAFNNKLRNTRNHTIAIVGDGAFIEGMSFEALNYAVHKKIPLIIVINDNGMSIPPNVGGIKNLFSSRNWQQKCKNYFTGLGYKYLSVKNGHDIKSLISTFKKAAKKTSEGTVIVHVKTEKGKGLAIAKNHQYKMHFSMPFDPKTGRGSSPVPVGESWAKVAGDTIYQLMKKDKSIIVITPATPYASNLDDCLRDLPERAIDVGMAEQHALGMASGLALNGVKPFVFYQSTFMQRALDQIIHDVCYMNLPVTILSVRSGFAGYDNPTHHGIYDLSYLMGVPNLKIFYPGSKYDLETIITERTKHIEGPMIILYPYGMLPQHDFKPEKKESSNEFNTLQIINEGKDGYILAVGNKIASSIKLRQLLLKDDVNFGVINIRWLKPLPTKHLLKILKGVRRLITVEENVIDNGFGSNIASFICDHQLPYQLLRIAIKQDFVEPGETADLTKLTNLDPISMFKTIKKSWPGLFKN